MKISKELLQRYELGQCSPEEEHVVRQWLDSNDWEDDSYEDIQVNDEVGKDMWSNITSHIEHTVEPSIPLIQKRRGTNTLRWLSAAALLALFLGLSCFFYSRSQDHQIELTNMREGLMWMRKDCFDLALQENSSIKINLRSDNILLSGSMFLKPKCNLSLYDRENKMSFDFIEGETYYIAKDPDTNKLVVFRQSEILFLPPILQRHLKRQFPISWS